jgi:hypothetical protein
MGNPNSEVRNPNKRRTDFPENALAYGGQGSQPESEIPITKSKTTI